MKFLIKIFCLLGFLSSFGFSKDVWVITDDLFGPIFPVENCEFFLGKSFFKCTNPETGSYRVSSTYVVKDYLYFNPTKSSGYFFDTNYYYLLIRFDIVVIFLMLINILLICILKVMPKMVNYLLIQI